MGSEMCIRDSVLAVNSYMRGNHGEVDRASAGKPACSYSPLSSLPERRSSAKVERLPSSAGMGPACRQRDKQQVGEQKHANPAVIPPPGHTSCLPTRWPVSSTSIVAHHTQLPRHFPDLLPYRSHSRQAAPNEMGRINTHTHTGVRYPPPTLAEKTRSTSCVIHLHRLGDAA